MKSKLRWVGHVVELIGSKGLHDLYLSPGIIKMMKSRKLRWAGHVVELMGDEKVNFKC
jgi:hypothetical protein